MQDKNQKLVNTIEELNDRLSTKNPAKFNPHAESEIEKLKEELE